MNVEFVKETIDDIKAFNVTHFTVSHLTEVFDEMIIASANSTQHARSIARHLQEECKKHNIEILGVEGDDIGDWILIDLGDVILHVMIESVRDYYQLEKLWDIPAVQ